MSFHTKIQPTVSDSIPNEPGFLPAMKQMPKSGLMPLFERQFSLQRLSSGDQSLLKDNSDEFEPSSVCLRKLVRHYIENPNSENQWCGGRNNCNNCRGSGSDSSSDEEEEYNGLLQSLKNLLFGANISEGERNLVTKMTELVEKNNHNAQLQNFVDELVALGYDAAICKSRWEKTRNPFRFAGQYEYLDVMIEGERVLIDIDFKSKFDIARPTKTYKSISQTLPYVFVGQVDLLKKVVIVVSKAAKKSMKKKGLPVPPWRTANYILTNWLAFYVRTNQTQEENNEDISVKV